MGKVYKFLTAELDSERPEVLFCVSLVAAGKGQANTDQLERVANRRCNKVTMIAIHRDGVREVKVKRTQTEAGTRDKVTTVDVETVREAIRKGDAKALLELSPRVASYCSDAEAWGELIYALAELDPTNKLAINAFEDGVKHMFDNLPPVGYYFREPNWNTDKDSLSKFVLSLNRACNRTIENVTKRSEKKTLRGEP